MKKIIKYYRKSNYGQTLEYIHPLNSGDAQIIKQLTGKTTVNSITRELIRDLSGGQVTFEETIAP